ncbi:MAG: GDP-mannose dehydrogenase [Zetaproteobacteria bacterium CG2_30_46_52]|nr:MAG: GDP-mannose dehydrogenase [Zetaproteobacteria bacterium CG2_30_46_52]
MKVAIVGMGYVGLPLALAFGRVVECIGFDISSDKIEAYRSGVDPTGEMEDELFIHAKRLTFTTRAENLKQADYVVVAVPTPIDNAHQPDLSPVINAAKTVGKHLKRGAIVIFESTVYPGVTEDFCVPILEEMSGYKCGEDFKVGYSPERVNPGDKIHRLETIVKVVSGQDEETLEKVAVLYELVIEAGVHRAPSIRVAEAAKVIENTQRDLNIALMNELAVIFDKMGIDTMDVLAAAGTKWNFLPFRPGLVGGHCIGVDPYYLTYKAEMMGYQPDVILSGRQINESMGKFIAGKTIKQMIASGGRIKGSTVLILGLAFKENCEDLRNTRVIDIVEELESYGVCVKVFDPIVSQEGAKREYGLDLLNNVFEVSDVSAVIAAVAHTEVVALDTSELYKNCKPNVPFIDVKSAFDREKLAADGFAVWRL